MSCAALLLLAAGSARGFEEPAVANRNLKAMIAQLETGNWNARIAAVHELDYLQSEGIPGLARATDDGDWQVRLTAVHALSSRGAEGAPILNRLLKNEPCPVVRLMTLHSLGSLGPEGEQEKAMGWISDASNKEVNACRDQPGPGRAAWVRGRRPTASAATAAAPAVAPAAAPPPKAPRAGGPAPEPVEDVEERDDAVVTRDPVPAPAPAAASPAKGPRPEDLPSPTKFQRHTELDALLDPSTEAVPRRGVVLEMSGRSTRAPEALPWPVAPIPREHAVDAPGLIMKDAGGKAPHDSLPDLLRALKGGDIRTRARAADDLGHLGAKAAPALPALMAALRDRSARVRASAGLALGNIGESHDGVVPLLMKSLKDRSEDVRYAAALGLSRIDTAEARDAFRRHVGKEARRAIDRPKARDKAASR